MRRTRILAALWSVLGVLSACGAMAQSGDDVILAAREAARGSRPDLARLASLREQALTGQHPLAMWPDYWLQRANLKTARQADLDAFYARWPGTYVEDRLRNDWLLELGQRRDWPNFRRDYVRFRMDDDREVRCYWLLTEHLGGQPVAVPALAAWRAQTRDDDGCELLAQTLAQAGLFKPADLWLGVRDAMQANRLEEARRVAVWIGADAGRDFARALDNPARYLAQIDRQQLTGHAAEVAALALLRLAQSDPGVSATQLETWEHRLPRRLAALAWAYAGRRAAFRLQDEAAGYYERAWRLVRTPAGGVPEVDWSSETLAWGVRAALRSAGPDEDRWRLVLRQINAMSPDDRALPAWQYWSARAELALAPAGEAGEPARSAARGRLQGIADGLDFYGKLAREDLGLPVVLPPAPPPPSEAEQAAVRRIPGLQRGLQLIALGLRSEGVREWNFALRDLEGDRQYLAAAQMACAQEVWDRCINTSLRTQTQIDMAQRYPTPLREAVLAATRDAALDPAYVYGLIRQESRFVMDARSHVGASGLMQLMPATARWTARKIGVDYSHAMITDRDLNLKLGTSYLKLVLDDFEGRMALGAAAYNAGPNRPRRWRNGPQLEAAAWVENIPFDETRGYVQAVLSNTVYYGALLGAEGAPSLRQRLGGPVGPKPPGGKEDRDLP